MADILNDDVLDNILQACPISVLATLCLVSSRIRVLAWPHMLRSVSLKRSPEGLLTFLNFIINNTQSNSQNVAQDPTSDPNVGSGTDISGAGRYIIKFEISFHPNKTSSRGPNQSCPVSAWAPVLTSALALMPNVQFITICNQVEEIDIHSPDFALALFSRPRLTSIDLREVGHGVARRFGQAMNSRKGYVKFKKIKFEALNSMDLVQLDLVVDEGLGNVLFHSMGYLTDLHIKGCNMQEFLREQGRNDTKTPVIFPKVVTLSLENFDVSIKAMAIAFPVVRTLILGDPWFSFYEDNTSSIPSFPSLTSIQSWTGVLLENFLARTSRAHCSVRRIVIVADYAWNPNTTRVVPGLKSLHFTRGGIKPLSWWMAFGDAIPHLTFLSLDVYDDYGSEDARDLLVSLAPNLYVLLRPLNFAKCAQIPRILSCAPLAYVSLTLHVIGELFVGGESLAVSYASSIPTLRYLDINIVSHYPSVTPLTTWWSVVREVSVSINDPVVQVRALDAAEGKVLRSQYDLES